MCSRCHDQRFRRVRELFIFVIPKTITKRCRVERATREDLISEGKMSIDRPFFGSKELLKYKTQFTYTTCKRVLASTLRTIQKFLSTI